MIDLYSANTPNGKKISIMLEEIGFDYKVIKVDINNGEQFKDEFKKISPLSKIPVIIDHKNKKTIFESGAILIYLAELSGKFYNSEERLEINQWLMAQMGYVGPMLGQHHQFHHYNPGKSKFGEERYFKISKRIYEELDERLSKSKSSKLVLIVIFSASLTISITSSVDIAAISLISPPTSTKPPFLVPVRKVSTATLDELLFCKAFVKT